MQVINLFDMTQKGVRLGLNEKDELEYYLYSGKGEITGQIATFEVFGNNGESRGPRRLMLMKIRSHDGRGSIIRRIIAARFT